jgi:hypothetical protein
VAPAARQKSSDTHVTRKEKGRAILRPVLVKAAYFRVVVRSPIISTRFGAVSIRYGQPLPLDTIQSNPKRLRRTLSRIQRRFFIFGRTASQLLSHRPRRSLSNIRRLMQCE